MSTCLKWLWLILATTIVKEILRLCKALTTIRILQQQQIIVEVILGRFIKAAGLKSTIILGAVVMRDLIIMGGNLKWDQTQTTIEMRNTTEGHINEKKTYYEKNIKNLDICLHQKLQMQGCPTSSCLF